MNIEHGKEMEIMGRDCCCAGRNRVV